MKLVPARPLLGSGIIFGMENETRRLSDLARILLVVAVLVTAVTTHYLDTAGVFRVQDLTATEMSETLRWLDQFYSAPEGLQRPNGIIVDGHVDFESIASWLARRHSIDFCIVRSAGSTTGPIACLGPTTKYASTSPDPK